MPKIERYLGFAFANSDLLLEVEPEGVVRFITGAVQGLTGRTPADVVGRPLRTLLSEADGRLVMRLLAGMGENERLEPRVMQLRHATAGDIACVMGAYHVAGRKSVNVTFARLTAREVAQAPSSSCDAETGLSSREAFQNYLAAMEGRGEQTRHLTLFRLGQLRDMCAGLVPSAASELLAEIGAVLRQYAPSDAAVARLGVDRFGMLHGGDLVDVVKGEIDAVVRSLVPEAADPIIDVQTLDTESLGLSLSDRVRVLLHVVRSFAERETIPLDPAGGRALVGAIVKDTVRRMISLRGDLGGRRIHMAYQPIIDLRTGRSHHLEALARGDDGRSYASGVAFAEQIGIATELDLFICRTVLRDLEKVSADCKVAVNLSGHSIESDVFVATLLELLRAHPRTSPRVLFELTETVGLRDIPRAARVINELRAAGHMICLDDFGAGAASFPYLRDLRFDYVKLDGSYVRNLGRSERDDAILGSMMRLCQQLKVQTIAEHVETVEQAIRLRGLKCNFAQGWLFGEAGPRIEVQHFDLSKLKHPSQWRSQLKIS